MKKRSKPRGRNDWWYKQQQKVLTHEEKQMLIEQMKETFANSKPGSLIELPAGVTMEDFLKCSSIPK